MSSMFAISIAALVLLSIIQISSQTKKQILQIERSEFASTYLSKITPILYSTNFNDLIDYCEQKNAVNKNKDNSCLANNTIKKITSNNQRDLEFGLESSLDNLEKKNTQNPIMCAELKRCNILAQGKILEVYRYALDFTRCSQHFKHNNDLI